MSPVHLFLSLCVIFATQQGYVGAEELSVESKKQLIVVSLPSESDDYYLKHLQTIADFVIEMDNKTKGRDHLIIIHDESGLKYIKHHNFTNALFIKVPKDQTLDLWMRDFPSCMPKQQIKFIYRPQYLEKIQADTDEEKFKRFASMVALPDLKQSSIVLEGGNIVDNGVDMAITTERPYKDNPGMTKEELIKKLESDINRKVAVVPDPQDTTGHADGIVSFVEKDVLLISLFDDSDAKDFYDSMETAVLKVFPKLQIVPLPCYSKKGKSQGFISAEGSYANSLVTNNAVYLPFFANQTRNQKAYEVFRNSTRKEVVPVYNAGKVPVYGGSLRCMTWQIDQEHPVAKALFAYARKQKSASSGHPNIYVQQTQALILSFCSMYVLLFMFFVH